jgi:predicted permease
MLRRIGLRLRAVFRRRALEQAMRDEMDAHLADATERLIARGLSPEEARLEARREFGNVGVLQEEARDARGARWVESFAGDVRFALRHFTRRPLHTATIVLVLALGIGGHAAVFSAVQAYGTRPAPGMPRDDALVLLRAKERSPESRRWYSRLLSYPEFRDLAELKESFTAVAGWEAQDGIVNLSTDGGTAGEPASALIYFVTDNYFTTAGVPLAFGTGFASSRGGESGDVSAVISHTMWQSVFAGRADVLGKSLRVNDVSVRIAGVAPPRFYGVTPTSPGRPSERSRVFWIPIHARSAFAPSSRHALASRDSIVFHAFARMAPGVEIDRATAAMKVATERAEAQMTPSRSLMLRDADVVPLRGDTSLPPSDNALTVAAVGGSIALLVLLVACTNVSALVVGAGIARRHEIAIRLSLGASRARVIRQLLTETAILAVLAGALGLAIYWLIAKLIATQASDIDLAPDFWTVAFTATLALGTGIVFGLSPALHATRHGVADALKDSGAGLGKRSRLQRSFVVAQIVFSQPLLVALAMMLSVVTNDGDAKLAPGVEEHVMTVQFRSFGGIGSKADKRAALERFRASVVQLPGVVDVAMGTMSTVGTSLMVHPDDRGTLARAAEQVTATRDVTMPGYFKILDIPMLRGREIVDGDINAVVIGDDLARSLWGTADPIGRRFREPPPYFRGDVVVVGVYDSRFATTRGAGIARVYESREMGIPDWFLIRTAGPAAANIESIRAIARREVPSIPLGRAKTLGQIAQESRTETLQVTAGAAGAGLLALLLASIGLYGVVALAVGQRRREIGIRMALGARPRQVVTLLFTSGVRLSVIGLVLGLPLSVVALRMIATMARIPETSLTGVGLGIAAVVLAVASLATWLPARRASTIDPALTLRTE